MHTKKTIEITCPLCGSDDTQRSAMKYADGTTSYTGRIMGASIGWFMSLSSASKLIAVWIAVAVVMPSGNHFWWAAMLPVLGLGVGFNLFYARIKMRSSTALAAENRPPKRFPTFMFAVFALPIAFSSLMALEALSPGIKHTSLGVTVTVLLWGIILAAAIWSGRQYNQTVWATKEAVWQRTFQCDRCGGMFIIADYDPVGINKVSSDLMGKGGGFPQAFEKSQVDKAREKGRSFDPEHIRKNS